MIWLAWAFLVLLAVLGVLLRIGARTAPDPGPWRPTRGLWHLRTPRRR